MFAKNEPNLKMNFVDYDASDRKGIFSQNKFESAAQMGFKSNLNSSIPKQSVGGKMPLFTSSAHQIQNLQNYV